MSAHASIPTPPIPGKDPPLQTSIDYPVPIATAAASISTSDNPPQSHSFIDSQRSGSKIPLPPPKTQTTSTSTLPLQASEIPQTSLPRPSFSPFFTLINDASSQSTYHPSRIQYIFSDDDESEILSAACVRSLQQDIEGESPAASRELVGSESGTRESETSSGSSATFKKGNERRNEKGKSKVPVKREERAIIVDINETGDGIVSTTSLSSCWQVVNAEVTNAPTLNNDSTGDSGVAEEEMGLMLKIEGIGVVNGDESELGDSGEKRKGKGVSESSLMGEEEMQTLLESFDRKMSLLRKIVASGDSWDESRKDKSAMNEEEPTGALESAI